MMNLQNFWIIVLAVQPLKLLNHQHSSSFNIVCYINTKQQTMLLTS